MSIITANLVVNQKYLEAVPRPPLLRYEEIKKDIFENGQQMPIIVNQNNVILDGHTRYQVCQDLDIIPKIEKRIFKSELEEERFVYSINVKRRDLEEFVHIELSLKIHEIDSLIGIAKRNSSLKQNSKSTVYPTLDKREKHNTLKSIADDTKTGKSTISKVKKILQNASSEDIQKLREGKKGISISKVFGEIQKSEKKKRYQDSFKGEKIQIPKRIQLFQRPFQELQIKDNSISLIFTNPELSGRHLNLYRDLAMQAMQILKDGGSLMCYAAQDSLDSVISAMKAEGLQFHWMIPVIYSNPVLSLLDKKITMSCKPILWFTKGEYAGKFVNDVIKSEFRGIESDDYVPGSVESDQFIKQITLQNDIVYDPFMGRGIFGHSANRLNRKFIGAETNPKYFQTAQKLISTSNYILQAKKDYLNKYNMDYKKMHRGVILQKQTNYQAKKRRLNKIIQPTYVLESLKDEAYTKFFKRKVQELKDNGRYDSI